MIFEHQMNIDKAQKAIEQRKPLVKDAKMRQRYHFMAEEGWINDPNGLIFYKGKYHYFYQYNPYDSFWGAMHWGHAISDDLLTWEYLPIALAPSEPYDNHEKGGCFSGSAIEVEDKLYLFYTATTNYGEGFVQTQCMAYSEDGVNFKKYEKNPVITVPEGYESHNFRDPKVWKYEDMYYMICASQKDEFGHALLFRSKNLTDWEFFNILAESRGEFGYMWECPDFYQLGNKHVLTFSPMGVKERTAVYLVGDMDYNTGKFSYQTVGEIDWGLDFYAPQSFLDDKNRRIMVGWANAWDWMPWWKDWGPTYQENWCGSFNIAREVTIDKENVLHFLPIKELENLRTDENKLEKRIFTKGKTKLICGDGISYEMKVEISLQKTTAESFSFHLRCSDEHETIVKINFKDSTIEVDRNNADGWSTGSSRSPLNLVNVKILDIHILSDQSSLEVFANDYKVIHSCNIFASNDQNENFIVIPDRIVTIQKIETWGLRKSIF